MPYFDRFDICGAHNAVEMDWHAGGVLWERASNRRRRESTGVQLERLGWRAGPAYRGFDSLTPNGQAIYAALCETYGFNGRGTNTGT